MAEDTSDDRTPSKTTRGEDEIISKGVEGYMPSQLLDLMSFNRNDLMTESNTAREGIFKERFCLKTETLQYYFEQLKVNFKLIYYN